MLKGSRLCANGGTEAIHPSGGISSFVAGENTAPVFTSVTELFEVLPLLHLMVDEAKRGQIQGILGSRPGPRTPLATSIPNSPQT